MTGERAGRHDRSRRLLIVLPALLLTGCVAAIGFAAHADAWPVDPDEAVLAVPEVSKRAIATRKRRVSRRTVGDAPSAIRRLVLAPRTQNEARAMVGFCDVATRTDIDDLRDIAIGARDPLAAGNAIRALGRLGVFASDDELVALVDDPRPRVRDESIIAIGASGDPACADALTPLLAHDDPQARRLALHALGRVGGEVAENAVAAVLDDASAPAADRAFARSALRSARRQ